VVVTTVKATVTEVGPPVTSSMAKALADSCVILDRALMKAPLEEVDEDCQAGRDTPFIV